MASGRRGGWRFRGARGAGAVASITFASALAFVARAAPGEGDVSMPGSASSAAPATSSSVGEETALPPSAWSADGDPRAGLDPVLSTGQFLDYGVSFTSEALLAPGGICKKDLKENCVLGSGGGLAFAGAYRNPGYSLGAVYEVTFHDSSNIYQRGVLQQARVEWRVRPRWLFISDSIVAFMGLGAGVAGYGDNWAISTYGPSAHAMVGGEIDLGVKVALVVSLSYRALYFKSFVDASGQERPVGVSHMLGLQLGLELHEPI